MKDNGSDRDIVREREKYTCETGENTERKTEIVQEERSEDPRTPTLDE